MHSVHTDTVQLPKKGTFILPVHVFDPVPHRGGPLGDRHSCCSQHPELSPTDCPRR